MFRTNGKPLWSYESFGLYYQTNLLSEQANKQINVRRRVTFILLKKSQRTKKEISIKI